MALATESGPRPVADLDLPYLDNGSPEYEADPYAVIEGLRAQTWIVRSRYGYTILSYDKAKEIKKGANFVRIFDAVTPEESVYLHDKAQRSVSSQSGPDLVRMRRLMLQALRPRMVSLLQPRMRAIFDDLLDEVAGDPDADLVRDVVDRYPGLVMGPILGVPFAETRELDRWASTINIMGRHAAYAAQLGEVEAAYRSMEQYLLSVIAQQRQHPTEDILGELIAAADADPGTTQDELLMLAHAIVNASIDNVRSELALIIEALVDHPQAWEALRRDPELVIALIEEGLRYSPAGDDIQHRVPATTVFHDVEFPEGTLVFINKKAVNRDPASIEDPHLFRIDRPASPHLTFGFGLHSCVGATVARAAIGEALLALSTRVRSWERAAPAERGPQASGGAPHTLPLHLDLAAAPPAASSPGGGPS